MSRELKIWNPLLSIQVSAKSLLISVIIFQRTYENLQKYGFVEPVVKRSSYVKIQNQNFIQEECLRDNEALFQEAADIAQTHGIKLEKVIEILTMFYEEVDDG